MSKLTNEQIIWAKALIVPKTSGDPLPSIASHSTFSLKHVFVMKGGKEMKSKAILISNEQTKVKSHVLYFYAKSEFKSLKS